MSDKVRGAPADERPEEGPARPAVEARRLVARGTLVARDAARVGGVLHEVLHAVAVDDEALDGAVQPPLDARMPTHGVREPGKVALTNKYLLFEVARPSMGTRITQKKCHHLVFYQYQFIKQHVRA